MPRSFWKGNNIQKELYFKTNLIRVNTSKNWVFTNSYKSVNTRPVISFYRRNQILTSSIIEKDLKFKIYNGYDFFKKLFNSVHVLYNISIFVLTRESKVVHKVKLSKEARKNQQMKNNKKKVNSAKKVVKKKIKKK